MNTQKKSRESPFKNLAILLEKRRKTAGFAQQAEFAQRIGVKQQTVSRWELGESRPRAKQIAQIATVLGCIAEELLVAAGYAPKAAGVSFDQPFPTDSLTAESFERFALYLLSRLFPAATVHRAGGQGHTQDGIDLEVLFPDGTVFTFQCKRVEEFGPQKVHAAVAKHKRKAKQKFILLSRVASPHARDAVRQHSGWDIWDKEDVSLKIRGLITEEQRRLVDIFFPGQRLALLGSDASSPWQTKEQFFAAYMNSQGAFNHAWELVGRASEQKELVDALEEASAVVVKLEGPGGGGKTRLVKEAVERYQRSNPGAAVWFLSPTEDATLQSLEQLGSGRKVLVVDDAHERSDLPLLFQYAADPGKNAKLLLSYRPYGATLIDRQSGRFALVDASRFVSLRTMGKKEATALAELVLKERDGPVEVAGDIAQLTLDCPLATVLGAHVVARDGKHFELAKNEKTFREVLFARFYEVVAGTIGAKADEGPIRKLLRVLSLLQPFNPEDPAVLEAVGKVEGLEAATVSRLVRVLSEGGVLFKRGGRYRLSPDLLADYIIEQTCVADDGASTGYAEKVFDTIEGTYLEQLVVNLGKLDWRRSNGDPSNSRLLDGIWARLKPEHEYGDPHLKAVNGVAYFQPARALHFVEAQIRNGRFVKELPAILKRIAYHIEHLRAACECLWHLGKADTRETNPYPEHAIRILRELCEVEPRKPARFIEVTVDFGIELLTQPDAWKHHFSPLDFLSGILDVEGHTTTATFRTITWSRFNVTPAFARPLRKNVIDAILRLLVGANGRGAVCAAQLLGDAVRYSMSGEAREEWAAEFAETLREVLKLVKGGGIEPVVMVEIARSVSWHAYYGDGAPSVIAKEIMAALPTTLEFRTTMALMDGWGMLLRQGIRDYRGSKDELEKRHAVLAGDLIRAYPAASDLRAYIEGLLVKITQLERGRNSSPHIFLGELTKGNVDLAEAILADALVPGKSETRKYPALALGVLLVSRRDIGLDYADRMLNADPVLQAAVGYGYCYGARNAAPEERETKHIDQLLQGAEAQVVLSGVAALRSYLIHPEVVLKRLVRANIGISAHVADEALAYFHGDNGELSAATSAEDVQAILEKLKPIPELNGHWLEEFLAHASQTHAIPCAEFFMDRVDGAGAQEDWKFRPCNHGPWRNVPLKFKESRDFPKVLRKVSDWLGAKAKASYLERMRAAELFTTMFAPFDATLLASLREWTETADEEGLGVIAQVLHEAPRDLVFAEREFVMRFLERCQQFGAECYKAGRSQLFAAAVSGSRSGTPGEPFPEDLRMKEQAEEALKAIPRFAPGRDLYDGILKHAEDAIKQQLKEGEEFDDK